MVTNILYIVIMIIISMISNIYDILSFVFKENTPKVEKIGRRVWTSEMVVAVYIVSR